jgi:hypothetical protein
LAGKECTITNGPELTVVLANDLVKVTLDKNGEVKGFKPGRTGQDAVGVTCGVLKVPGQIGHLGHVVIDSLINSPRSPGFGHLVSRRCECAEDGSFVRVVYRHAGKGDDCKGYYFSRWYQLRADSEILECGLIVENESGEMRPFAMHVHNMVSPGAQMGRMAQGEYVFIPLKTGMINIQQSEEYGNKPVFGKEPIAILENDRDKEFPRYFYRPAEHEHVLAHPWEVVIDKKSKRGMATFSERNRLLGFYNWIGDKAMTVEHLTRQVLLKPGDKWEMQVQYFLFAGLEEPGLATPLFVTAAKELERGSVLLPSFRGALVVEIGGQEKARLPVEPSKPVELGLDLAGMDWRLRGLDTQGREIAVVSVSSDPKFVPPPAKTVETPPMEIRDRFYESHGNRKNFQALVRNPTTIVVYGRDMDKSTIRRVKALSDRYGLPVVSDLITQTASGCYLKNRRFLVIGDKKINELTQSITAFDEKLMGDVPKKGFAALVYMSGTDVTGTEAALLMADEALMPEALAEFEKRIKPREVDRAGFVLAPADVMEKYLPCDIPTMDGEKVLRLETSRNEYESAQFLVSAHQFISDWKVDVVEGLDPDGKKIPPNHLRQMVRVRQVMYFPLDRPEYDSGIPDPLLGDTPPAMAPFTTTPMWVTVQTKNHKPGVYKVVIRVTGGGATQDMPIEVVVWDINLPINVFHMQPWVDYDSLAFYNYKAELYTTRYWTVFDDFIENMLEHGVTVFIPANIYTLFSKDDWSLDFTYWDMAVERILAKAGDRQVLVYVQLKNTAEVCAWLKKHRPDQIKDDKDPALTSNPANLVYVRFAEHLKEKDWLDRISVKVTDEPTNIEEWLKCAEVVRKAGLQVHTHFNHFKPQAYQKLIGKVMPWIQGYTSFDKDFFLKRRDAGEMVMWYTCWIPSIAADSPLSEIQGYFWQSAKYDLAGCSFWGIQCWNFNRDIWKEAGSQHNSVVYPPRGQFPYGPIAESIRWETIREGVENVRYVKLLRQLIAEAEKNGDQARKEKAAAALEILDNIFKTHFPDLDHYKPGREVVYGSRRKIAEAIMSLQTE